jgi:hypothetical protein
MQRSKSSVRARATKLTIALARDRNSMQAPLKPPSASSKSAWKPRNLDGVQIPVLRPVNGIGSRADRDGKDYGFGHDRKENRTDTRVHFEDSDAAGHRD